MLAGGVVLGWQGWQVILWCRDGGTRDYVCMTWGSGRRLIRGCDVGATLDETRGRRDRESAAKRP